MVTLYCKIITNTNSQQKQFDMLHLHQDPKITICQNSSHIVEICIWNRNLFFWPKIQRPSVLLSRIPILWDYQTSTCLFVQYHICYSSNKIRKTQNEHLNIICQNLNSHIIVNLMQISWLFWVNTTCFLL